MQPAGAPAHLRFEVTFDPSVEQGKHDSQHTSVGVQAAHDHLANSPTFQFSDLRLRQSIFAHLVENQVSLANGKQQFTVGGAGCTGSAFEEALKGRGCRIDESCKDPAGKWAAIAFQFFEIRRRRIERSLNVDNDKATMGSHAAIDLLTRKRSPQSATYIHLPLFIGESPNLNALYSFWKPMEETRGRAASHCFAFSRSSSRGRITSQFDRPCRSGLDAWRVLYS